MSLMVWKGIDNDQNIYYTQRFGGHWDPQQSGPIPAIATNSRPALCNYTQGYMMAWKAPNDGSIWYATYDGTTWGGQRQVQNGALTSDGPALIMAGIPLMVWKAPNDGSIWYAKYDEILPDNTLTWGQQRQVQPQTGGTPLTSTSPGLALLAFGAVVQVLMVWKAPNDESIWYAIFDGTTWGQQRQVQNGALTTASPAVLGYPGEGTTQGRVFMAWKGTDQSIWYAWYDGTSPWGQQQQFAPNPATSTGPALTFDEFNQGDILIAWKGANNDDGIYGTLFGDGFSQRQQVPVGGTSTGPAIH